jgi:hypothetical protein
VLFIKVSVRTYRSVSPFGYPQGTFKVHSMNTHSTLTVRQYCILFPYTYLCHFMTIPCLDCERCRGQCYWNRVKAVWPSSDWTMTVHTGSIWRRHWEDSCSVNWWEGLSVAAVATSDSFVMLLLIVAMCIAHQMYTDINKVFGLNLQYCM